MKFINLLSLGEAKGSPRLYFQNERLRSTGFNSSDRFTIQPKGDRIHLDRVTGTVPFDARTVSQKRGRNDCPVIDINSKVLSPLAGFETLKVTGFHNRLVLTASNRAFHIRKALQAPKLEVCEIFCGGGTIATSLRGNPHYETKVAIDSHAPYLHEYGLKESEPVLIQTDLKKLAVNEIPSFNCLVAGIPCTDHSNLGRAKKSLAGKPEQGEFGDLFFNLLSIIHYHTPRCLVLENVANYKGSYANEVLQHSLHSMGYHVSEYIIDAHGEWGDIQDRRRWILVAHMKGEIHITPPMINCDHLAERYLNAPSEQDKIDCNRISKTIDCLRAHNARHQAQGHGFGFTTINGESTKIPTIVKSGAKINTGPFVETAYGLRQLRKGELERISGHTVVGNSATTAYEIIGQGVAVRTWKQIFDQIAEQDAYLHSKCN